MKKRRAKWKVRDVCILLERIELYLSSGLAIDMALRLCVDGVSTKHKPSVRTLITHIESGALFSSGLIHMTRLSGTLASIIANGEKTGNLSSSIAMVRDILEKQEELMKKCFGAMVYPGVIGIFSVVFVIALMRGVMPQIVPMLKGLHTELPLISRVMIFCSDVVLHYGLYIAIIIIIFAFVAIWFYGHSMLFRKFVQSCVSKTPLIGVVVRNYNVVIFLRSFGSLIDGGQSIAKAFSDAVNSIGYVPIRRLLEPKIPIVSRGSPLNIALSILPTPQYIVALAAAGESSGTLGLSILRAANILDREIEHSLKKLTALIEPIMMIAMGVVVGAIALSILMPIYDLSKTLQH